MPVTPHRSTIQLTRRRWDHCCDLPPRCHTQCSALPPLIRSLPKISHSTSLPLRRNLHQTSVERAGKPSPDKLPRTHREPLASPSSSLGNSVRAAARDIVSGMLHSRHGGGENDEENRSEWGTRLSSGSSSQMASLASSSWSSPLGSLSASSQSRKPLNPTQSSLRLPLGVRANSSLGYTSKGTRSFSNPKTWKDLGPGPEGWLRPITFDEKEYSHAGGRRSQSAEPRCVGAVAMTLMVMMVMMVMMVITVPVS